MRKFSFFLFPAFLLLLVSCSQRRYEVFSGYAQGGTWSVKANLASVKTSKSEIKAAIDSILTLVDTTFSGYNKASILSRRNAGEDIATNDVWDSMIAISRYYKEKSDGAFDPASAPLFDVWGFGFTADSLPSQELINGALELCKEEKRLNFNAIAQGFTCDLVACYLHSIGVKDMLVDIGEIYCEGLNPSGVGWSIGIDTPDDGNNDPGAHLSGIWHSDGGSYGVVTSGNYRKFYVRDGRKYAHTIDPRTGFPVDHKLLSATVIAPNATAADAIATWFMVVGEEKAKEIVMNDDSLEACLITSDGTWASPGFFK